MPEYSIRDIDQILEKVESHTLEIDFILSDYEDVTEIDSESLLMLYAERKKYLDVLQVLYNNFDGREFINKNSKLNWNKRISSIIIKDKKQLERIQNVIVDVSGKLKNIVKQKSLLIYSR